MSKFALLAALILGSLASSAHAAEKPALPFYNYDLGSNEVMVFDTALLSTGVKKEIKSMKSRKKYGRQDVTRLLPEILKKLELEKYKMVVRRKGERDFRISSAEIQRFSSSADMGGCANGEYPFIYLSLSAREMKNATVVASLLDQSTTDASSLEILVVPSDVKVIEPKAIPENVKKVLKDLKFGTVASEEREPSFVFLYRQEYDVIYETGEMSAAYSVARCSEDAKCTVQYHQFSEPACGT